MSDDKNNNKGDDATVAMTTSRNDKIMEGAGVVHMDEGQPWGVGILNDMKRTVGTNWVKEMTNLNQKTIAVTLLIFISVIAPTLTFGAVYGKETDNKIGAVETILATAWVGVAYSLIGGMPLCIIGSTGPVLAFTKAVVRIADNIGVPFLTFNAWISCWLLFYCFVAAFFDLTRVVRLATRFTDEIFAFLIVSIFVFDAVGDPFSDVGILRYFDPNHPSHEDYADDESYNYMEVALLSTLLGFGTTALIFLFRSFKDSSFFCNDGIRSSLHDFSVTMSVLVMTAISEFLFSDVDTEQLNVPSKFEPSFKCCDSSCTTFFPDECPELSEPHGVRDWFVDFADLNGKGWVPMVAAGPAILAFLLVFLDSGITWHLVNHPNNNLKHGEAYNYDLCLVGIFNFVNGCFGLPWLVATTVPCIIHLNSLAEKDSEGKIISVQETRLTMFFSHMMVGLSLLVLSVLQLLPMPVLYGVFLFMGLSALPAMQFWNRILLWFQQPSKYPDFVFTRYMEKKKIHLYTVLQLFFFGLVFLVQNMSAISIIFPLMTLLCIPARLYFLPRFFSGWELCLLDGDDEEIAKWVSLKRASMRSLMFGQADSFAESSSVDSPEEADPSDEDDYAVEEA
eukprot:CAMPEP_0172446898 /NCGR_PEP_ID=MMETSP1065-20121228/6351_1 /TAXON_ID=265537 /ORGANISM="Amphiprora paludosa, Strain CCMP125" /LENGTH=619 /DNA_ID=CAMNT_0013198087 /DNA_START=229 /DNA_END=2088 /DNA_ORIENTATION=+